MMMPHEALLQLLLDDTDVYGLVGKRIRPQQVQPGTILPYITFHQLSGVQEHCMTGASEFARALFQIECFAATYKASRELADKVQTALNGYKGTVSGAAGTLVIGGVYLEGNVDGYSAPSDGGNTGNRWVTHDYSMTYQEST